MFFGRLFDPRRKSKSTTDGLSSSPSSSGTTTPVLPNKLRRNRTVSVSTNVAKETNAPIRKHLSIAVPRASKATPHTFILPTPSTPPRSRAISIATPNSSTPATLSINVTRPRSTFERSRRAEQAALTHTDTDLRSPSSPSPSNDRSVRTSVAADSPAVVASSSCSITSVALSESSTATTTSRPLFRRGASAPPTVAGVVRAELDADGLYIRDAHAHRPEPILIVPREHVAELCGVVGVWEEEEEEDAASDDDARTIVFTAEPENMLPSEADLLPTPSAVPSLSGTFLRPPLATLTRLPATAPSTPKRTQSARYYFARRRTQSLISPQRYRRADLRPKVSTLATKRTRRPSAPGTTMTRRRSRRRSSTARKHGLAIVRSSSTGSARSTRSVRS